MSRCGGAPAESDELSDERLAGAVARRDDSSTPALEQLFHRHADALLRFLTRAASMNGEQQAQQAEDLVHDVFVKVAEAAETFRGECAFRTWLFTLALNLLRSRRRRAALEEKASERMAFERPAPAQADGDPALNMQRRELLERLGAAIERLGDGERETLQLYWFGEMSYSEISLASGISVAAAKVRVHRALARLGRLLDDD